MAPITLEDELVAPRTHEDEVVAPITHEEVLGIETPCNCPKDSEGKDSEPPHVSQPLIGRISKPYLGAHDQRLWDKRGFMGRLISPFEELYFHFIPNEEMVRAINSLASRNVVT